MIKGRPDYYEEDAVYYTSSGKHPQIPEYLKIHVFRWDKHKHKLKSFYSCEHAEVALSYAKRHSFPTRDKYVSFYCNECGLYHITSEKNYQKYLDK